jgi:hypothetical protein
MNNIAMAINILVDLISTVSEVTNTIAAANAAGVDITDSQLQQIITQRNKVLDQLEAIAYGGQNETNSK